MGNVQVCMPGLDRCKQTYRTLVSSGRVEEDDSRLVQPTGRVKDWVHPALGWEIAAAAGSESDQN